SSCAAPSPPQPPPAAVPPAGLDSDGGGCSDVKEPLLCAPTNAGDPWDFFSVPVPALFAAPSPASVFRHNVVSAADAQAVFAYFKASARTGTLVYEKDLNLNATTDAIEYVRS